MSVKIRFTRLGKPKNPFYRIVVTDSRLPRDSEYLDKVGHFNPLIKKEDRTAINFRLDREKVISWLKKGAQPTQVVKDLIKEERIWDEFVNQKSKKKKSNKRKSCSHSIGDMLKRKEEKKKLEEIKKRNLERKSQKIKNNISEKEKDSMKGSAESKVDEVVNNSTISEKEKDSIKGSAESKVDEVKEATSEENKS